MKKITNIDENSIARKAGIRIGEYLLRINGNNIHDVLDYMYYSAERALNLEITDDRGHTRVIKLQNPNYEPLGLEFETYLMDKARSCVNKCVFCFIDQLPDGLRPSLYFKDDDARLSFLLGNYITLTNLSGRELERIIKLHISPVNISVHATEPETRLRLLGNPRAKRCYEIMKRLADNGITMNCQIVIVPGYNDGKVLEHTLRELSELYPHVASVSVVPVGLTRYRDGLADLRSVTRDEALSIVREVDRFGEAFLRENGSRLFFCGDELYLRAGAELPPLEYYEDFPQFENGIGMLKAFEIEFIDALDTHSKLNTTGNKDEIHFSVATGYAALNLFKNLLQMLSKRCYNVKWELYGIRNDFFGECVDVAGLITGQDLAKQLAGRSLGSKLLISASMLRHGGDLFLDDYPLTKLSETLGVPVIPVPNDGKSFYDAIFTQYEVEQCQNP